MKRLLIAASLIASFGASAELVKFSSGDVLTATDLNNNFEHVEQLADSAPIKTVRPEICDMQQLFDSYQLEMPGMYYGKEFKGLDGYKNGMSGTVFARYDGSFPDQVSYSSSKGDFLYISENGQQASFDIDVIVNKDTGDQRLSVQISYLRDGERLNTNFESPSYFSNPEVIKGFGTKFMNHLLNC